MHVSARKRVKRQSKGINRVYMCVIIGDYACVLDVFFVCVYTEIHMRKQENV